MFQWAQIRHMHLVEGVPKKEVARRLKLDVKTVRRAIAQPTPPVRMSPPRPSSLDPWRERIRRWLREEPRVTAKRIRRLLLPLAGPVPARTQAAAPAHPARPTGAARPSTSGPTTWRPTMPSDETPTTPLQTDLRRLGFNRTADDLNDLVASATRKRWSTTVMLEHIVAAELQDRQRRSVERRLTCARLGRFKPLADWDWDWPTAFDRPALERILTLDFLARGENVILVGAQGLGKTMLAKNIAHQAILAGHSALFTTAADLLLDLNGQETARALERRLRHYTRPSLLVVD